MDTRLERAAAARDMISRMQRCVRALGERKFLIMRDVVTEVHLYDAAIERADDALQFLWTQLHYLSVPTRMERQQQEKRGEQLNLSYPQKPKPVELRRLK